MNSIRRALVAAFVFTLVKPLAALAAWNKEAFGANGAVVPIEISSAIAGTTALTVVIDKNPFPLIARFDFKEGALPFVKVNVKMGETSDVRVLAEAGGKHYVATKEVKVTIGGCGG